jgi:hypothetical protein
MVAFPLMFISTRVSLLAADVEPRLLMLRLAIDAACVIYAGRTDRVSNGARSGLALVQVHTAVLTFPIRLPVPLPWPSLGEPAKTQTEGSLFEGTEDSSLMTYFDLLLRFSSFLSRRFSSFA